MNVNTITSGLVALAWLAVVAVFVILVLRASRNQPLRNAGFVIGIPVIFALLITSLSAGIVFINPPERGVVISMVAPGGYRSQSLDPGLHWIIPFAEHVITYPVSKQTYTMSIASSEGDIQGDDSITARTSDGQEIKVDASVIYALDPNKVVQVHIAWQDRYTQDLVRPLARGIIRDVVSQYGVEQVVSSKRFEMAQQIHDAMSAKLAANGISLLDFILRNITFSADYAASVEQKQIAEQRAEQARYTVEQKKQEAEQARQEAEGIADATLIRAKKEAEARVVQAQGESQALELIAKVLRDNPTLLQYQYITKLSPNVQVMLLPAGNQQYILPLPEMGPTQTPSTSGFELPTPVPTPAPKNP